ncbi:unnamed protein product [Rotaria sordida]|uniref:Uncharacterized protein n=1 Tax=Rotaria sordida TaxID=392033 RepID=A0A819PXL6_9BILA|nr:unnamed protein product [Rotaria sordida]CAF4025032.1 unnamed protein product [Rotaria sordida]
MANNSSLASTIASIVHEAAVIRARDNHVIRIDQHGRLLFSNVPSTGDSTDEESDDNGSEAGSDSSSIICLDDQMNEGDDDSVICFDD